MPLERENLINLRRHKADTIVDLTRTSDCENSMPDMDFVKCISCSGVSDSYSVTGLSGLASDAECSKCHNARSLFQIRHVHDPPKQILQPPLPEFMHHKKLRHYLREGKRASPDPSDDDHNGPLTTVNSTYTPPSKLPRSTSLSHHGSIRIDERQQRQLVATRDIAEGELILQETPIVGAPMSKEFYIKKKVTKNEAEAADHSKFKSVCLTCCRNVQTNYKCSRCGFPMCNIYCEKHSDHADFECEVFASNPVAPIVHASEYKKIKLLRCLLLREKDPARWKKIMDLDPHDQLRAGNVAAATTTIALCKFIQHECHLKQYDFETINRIIGVNTVQSHTTWNPSAYPITESQNNEITKASLTFHKARLLTHDCKPNTRCIMSQTGIGTENFMVTVIASTPIPKGQVLTNCYVDVTLGTFQRRKELLDNYYLSCTCRRCMDPNEESTFYSALKCPKCPNGQLLPGNPLSLDLNSVWLCNLAPRCDFIIIAAQVMDLLHNVRTDVENAAVDQSLFQEYQNLQKVLQKYRGKILHKNHFYIMNIQYALIIVINQLLELVNEEEALRLSQQQIIICRQCIDLVDVLRPGNNRIRGNLLYFFHEGLLMTFLVEAKQKMSEPNSNFAVTGRKQFEDILNIMKMGRECLIVEPIGSPEHTRALKLSLDSSGLQPLMRYFNIST